MDIIRNEKMQLIVVDLPMPNPAVYRAKVYENPDINASLKARIVSRSREVVISGTRRLLMRRVTEQGITDDFLAYDRSMQEVVLQERPCGQFERRIPLSYEYETDMMRVVSDGQMQVLVKKLLDPDDSEDDGGEW